MRKSRSIDAEMAWLNSRDLCWLSHTPPKSSRMCLPPGARGQNTYEQEYGNRRRREERQGCSPFPTRTCSRDAQYCAYLRPPDRSTPEGALASAT